MKSVSFGIKAGVVTCLFLSGMAGLTYEVTWARYLALFLGHGSYAVTIVLATFMGGLALGYYFLGSRADSTNSPLLLFGWFEIAVGIYAFLFPSYFVVCQKCFEILAHGTRPGSLGLNLLKLLFCLLLILPPTVLMGGTLPILVKVLTSFLGEIRERVAELYSANSAGAVLGCLMAEFWFIPRWGLPTTLFVGGLANLVAGTSALLLTRLHPGRFESNVQFEDLHDERRYNSTEVRLISVAVAVSGFVAMLYEVAWGRLLALAIGSSVHAFALMLAMVIAGIAAGAWAARRWNRMYNAADLLGWIEVGMALLLGVSLCLYRDSPYWFSSLVRLLARESDAYPLDVFFQAILCFVIIFPAAVGLGTTLPLASRVLTGNLQSAGRSVGRTFSFNTLGTVLGAVATGSWLMPWLGLTRTFAFGITVTFVLGVAVLIRNYIQSWRRVLLVAPLFVAACCWLAGATLDDSLRRSLTLGVWREPASLKSRQEFREVARQNDLVYYRDGADATVSVNTWTEGGEKQLTLRVNGKPDASTTGDMGTQLLLGHLPMLLRPDSSSVLAIGLGSGMTCGAVACYPSLRHIDAVEISPEVAVAARLFDEFTGNVLSDGRLKLSIEDAKTFLQLSDQNYDVIISEPSNPWMAGVAGLYTREFYQSCRNHLRSDGLMAQWVHLYETSDEALDLVMRTFVSVFPSMSIWQSRSADLILIGSALPPGVDFQTMQSQLLQPKVREDLARIGITRLPALLAREVIPEGIGRFVPTEGMLHTDTRPVLEYEAQRALFVHRWAERWRVFDETLSPRADTLLASYLKSHPLTPDDYEAFARYYAINKLPTQQALASLFLRWQKESPISATMLDYFARLVEPGPAYELEALRWAPLRETLFKRAETNPFLLRHYAELLLATYRFQRSVFYLPPVRELESVLGQLTQIDPDRADIYSLQRAALAWDRGDLASCLRLSDSVLSGAEARSGVRRLEQLRSIDDEVPALLIQAYLSDNKVNEAQTIRQKFRDAGLRNPRLEMYSRKIEAGRFQPR